MGKIFAVQRSCLSEWQRTLAESLDSPESASYLAMVRSRYEFLRSGGVIESYPEPKETLLGIARQLLPEWDKSLIGAGNTARPVSQLDRRARR